MRHERLPQPKAYLNLISVAYSLAFDMMLHPLSFRATNTGYTKP